MRRGRLLWINFLVLVAILAAGEIYFRVTAAVAARYPVVSYGLWQTFKPYVMVAGKEHETYGAWPNSLTGTDAATTVRTNAGGFNDVREFSITKPYVKAANEKVILFTGGSAAWGFGASATDKTVAARMEHYLNAAQSRTKYSVFNLGMGSWIAFQEYVALELWGAQFRPDWVIVMDGFDDASVGCLASQGPGNPMLFATMRSYIHGYLLSTKRPVFYRSELENELIRHSVAYRALTGKQIVENDQLFDPDSTAESEVRRQIIPTKVGQGRDMLDFYIGTQRGILKLYPGAKYILSTQPVVNTFSDDFVDIYDHPVGSEARAAAIAKRERDLEHYLTVNRDLPCGEKNGTVAFTYVFGNGATRLEQLAASERARGRSVEYHNLGTLIPNAREERKPYFIDSVHLSDKGMDLIGKFYAERVLAADRPGG